MRKLNSIKEWQLENASKLQSTKQLKAVNQPSKQSQEPPQTDYLNLPSLDNMEAFSNRLKRDWEQIKQSNIQPPDSRAVMERKKRLASLKASFMKDYDKPQEKVPQVDYNKSLHKYFKTVNVSDVLDHNLGKKIEDVNKTEFKKQDIKDIPKNSEVNWKIDTKINPFKTQKKTGSFNMQYSSSIPQGPLQKLKNFIIAKNTPRVAPIVPIDGKLFSNQQLIEQNQQVRKRLQEQKQRLERMQKQNQLEQKQLNATLQKDRCSVESLYEWMLKMKTSSFVNQPKPQHLEMLRVQKQFKMGKTQHAIYNHYINHNIILDADRVDDDENRLDLYQKDRKAYMIEMEKKVSESITKLLERKIDISTSTPDDKPFINFQQSKLILAERFLINKYKYRDYLDNQFYEVIDLNRMKKCLGKFRKVKIANRIEDLIEDNDEGISEVDTSSDTFETLISILTQIFENLDLKHSYLAQKVGLIRYENENVQGYLQISEFQVNGSSLHELMTKYGTFSQVSTKFIFKKICTVLKYLNDQTLDEIVYPSKVFIYYGDVQLSSYGYDSFVDIPTEQFERMLQSQKRYYYPPEILDDNQESRQSSSWSFGILMFEALYGIKPFKYKPEEKFNQELIFPEAPVVSDSTKEMIRECLQAKPDQRISTADLYKKYFYNKI